MSFHFKEMMLQNLIYTREEWNEIWAAEIRNTKIAFDVLIDDDLSLSAEDTPKAAIVFALAETLLERMRSLGLSDQDVDHVTNAIAKIKYDVPNEVVQAVLSKHYKS